MNWRTRARALADYLRTGHILDNVTVHGALLAQANALAAELRTVSDAALRERVTALRREIDAGLPQHTASPRLFALVREIADRELGLRPFDMQLLAGFALAGGKLVQMQTGEGKTLAAVAPAALHAMRGGGVHVLTFNDYLAGRDAAWMRPIYSALRLSVGVVREGMPIAERRAAYRADVTYVTAKEAGFDYLRDGLAYDAAELTHRPLNVALIDEADSILIDEARIPLVIAGAAPHGRAEPERIAALIAQLHPGAHYTQDAERRSAHLTEAGIDQLEAQLGCGNLYDLDNLTLLTEVNAALSALLLRRDADYIVRDGRVELVDEFTGRVADKRQWPDGLQAAIEAKEGVRRSARGHVLGQITLQHFLLQYPTLCGMTATAATAADELLAVYGLEVQLASPNQPCIRADLPDLIFTHADARLAALCDEVTRLHTRGQPVLVGTLTVAESEAIAHALAAHGIRCAVLNAKNNAEEARIVAEAGRLGAVTIATNMAGRGTDIRLGGTQADDAGHVRALGGLVVIGMHRHETHRVDDQLRGRAGRQGDPGTSRFFVSLDDDLIQQSGVARLLDARKRRPARQAAPVDDPELQRLVGLSQRIVEGRNGDLRRGLWHYARLLEQQRQAVYAHRLRVLHDTAPEAPLRAALSERVAQAERHIGAAALTDLARRLTLDTIDQHWAEHLATVADAKESIHLMAIGKRSPFHEYQKVVVSAFEGFFAAVDARVLERFAALPLSTAGLTQAGASLRGPSSTWTYTVEEEIHKDSFGMLLIKQSDLQPRRKR